MDLDSAQMDVDGRPQSLSFAQKPFTEALTSSCKLDAGVRRKGRGCKASTAGDAAGRPYLICVAFLAAEVDLLDRTEIIDKQLAYDRLDDTEAVAGKAARC